MTVRQRGSKGSGGDGSSSSDKPGPFSGRYNPKLQKRPESTADGTSVRHQTWARVVMVAGVLAVIYFSGSSKNSAIMAKQKDLIHPKRYQQFLCPPSFKKELEEAAGGTGCVPAKCGRMISDTVVSLDEANQLLLLAKKGLSKGGGSGGASILDLHSGALSKGEAFTNFYMAHPDLFTASDLETYRSVKEKIRAAVADHFQLSDPASLHLTHPTFFSRLDGQEARTAHDEYWHVHVDRVAYPEFHYTSLLYLTDHGQDFTGGEFVFVDEQDKMNRTVEPRVGRVSAFTSGVENKHHVERVRSGVRYALTIGFSCDPKNAIPEPGTEAHEAFQRGKRQ